jgi:hypothetical protein
LQIFVEPLQKSAIFLTGREEKIRIKVKKKDNCPEKRGQMSLFFIDRLYENTFLTAFKN